MENYRSRVNALMGSVKLPQGEHVVRGETAGGDGRLSHDDGLGCARGIVAGTQIMVLSAGAMCLGLYWLLR